MYLIISHFTKNKGTTDYLLEYFERNKKSYYFLRHPFNFENKIEYSELIYFDGKDKNIIGKYKKFNNSILDLLRNFFINFYVSFRYLSKYKKIIGFGSFNIVPILFTRLFNKKINFYGVDYSTKRFENRTLNGIYKIFETFSCKISNKTFSASERQAEARIGKHGLKKEKSIVINNGINFEYFTKIFNEYNKIGFFYLGSITKQHGIIQFIKYFYIKNTIDNKLYVIGGGEEEGNLRKLIKKNNLENKIIFYGSKRKSEIKSILKNINEKLFGIAPYDKNNNDHVYYGDALKIKEYLMYNIPYIVSDVLYIQENLKFFGIKYKLFNDINFKNLKVFRLNLEKKNKFLEKYDWNNLFDKYFG